MRFLGPISRSGNLISPNGKITHDQPANIIFSYIDENENSYQYEKTIDLKETKLILSSMPSVLHQCESGLFITALSGRTITDVTLSTIINDNNFVTINDNVIKAKDDISGIKNITFGVTSGQFNYSTNGNIEIISSLFMINILSADLYDGESTGFEARLDNRDVTVNTLINEYSENISINENNRIIPANQISGNQVEVINFRYTDEYGKIYYATDSIELKETELIISSMPSILHQCQSGTFTTILRGRTDENVTLLTTINNNNFISINDNIIKALDNVVGNDELNFKLQNETYNYSTSGNIEVISSLFTVNILSADLYDGESTPFVVNLSSKLKSNNIDTINDKNLIITGLGLSAINGLISPTGQIMNDESSIINFKYTDEYGKIHYATDSIELKETKLIIDSIPQTLHQCQTSSFTTILSGRTNQDVTNLITINNSNFIGVTGNIIKALDNVVGNDELNFELESGLYTYSTTANIEIVSSLFTANILSADLYDDESTIFVAELDGNDVSNDKNLIITGSGLSAINGLISPTGQIMNDESVIVYFNYTDEYGKPYQVQDSIELKKTILSATIQDKMLLSGSSSLFTAILSGRYNVDVTLSTDISNYNSKYIGVNNSIKNITAIDSSITGNILDTLTFTYEKTNNNLIYSYSDIDSLTILSSTFNVVLENSVINENTSTTYNATLDNHPINPTDIIFSKPGLLSLENNNIIAGEVDEDTPTFITFEYTKNDETVTITSSLIIRDFKQLEINLNKNVVDFRNLEHNDWHFANGYLYYENEDDINGFGISATYISEGNILSAIETTFDNNSSQTSNKEYPKYIDRIGVETGGNDYHGTFATIDTFGNIIISGRCWHDDNDGVENITNPRFGYKQVDFYERRKWDNSYGYEIYKGSLSATYDNDIISGIEFTSTSNLNINSINILTPNVSEFINISNDGISGIIGINEGCPSGQIELEFYSDDYGGQYITKIINVIQEPPLNVFLSKNAADFNNIEHDWHFVWNKCSGYFKPSDETLKAFAGDNLENLEGYYASTGYYGSRQETENYSIGYDNPETQNSSSINYYIATGNDAMAWTYGINFKIDKLGNISGNIYERTVDDGINQSDLILNQKYDFNSIFVSDEVSSKYLDGDENNKFLYNIMLNADYNDNDDIISGIEFTSNLNIDNAEILTPGVSDYINISNNGISGIIEIGGKCPSGQVEIEFYSGHKNIIKTINIINSNNFKKKDIALFNISNSEILDVNGDYHEVKAPGINIDDYNNYDEYYTAVLDALNYPTPYPYLGESQGLYTNEKCYVNYTATGTSIEPIGSNGWYYFHGGGAASISDMETDYDSWQWNDNPNGNGSQDWSNRNILHVESHDGKIY